MAYESKYYIELFECLIDTLGKEGPFEVNTHMAGHNIFLEESESCSLDDIIILGTAGKAVTIEDIKILLSNMKDYMNQEVFNNGRSYFFEGVYKLGDKSFSLSWGS